MSGTIKILKELLDESERYFLAELDEGHYYPHLLKRLNNARKFLGMEVLKLSCEDTSLPNSKKVEVLVNLMDHFDMSFPLPNYETSGSAGCDVRASLHEEDRKTGIRIISGERVLIPTGIKMAIPEGYEIQVRPRSGLSLKTNLRVLN